MSRQRERWWTKAPGLVIVRDRRVPMTAGGELSAAFLVVVACLVGGCSVHRVANPPLGQWSPDQGYRLEEVAAKKPIGDVLLVLAFSGGGTRASALSYGVLRELRDTPETPDKDSGALLREVDMISSVSGGSFTSAYYGLFGDRVFEDYEEKFLRRNIQRQLIWELLRPWNWFRLALGGFSRTELAIKLYDREIFDRGTYADLEAADSPYIRVNSTDLTVGDPFTFVQPQFDLMCSDLSRVTIARAVAASSAVPGVFSPLTLRNYAGTCGFEQPQWVDEALADRRASPRRYQNAQIFKGFLDAKARKYIHLVDGGIADNLGLRKPLDNVLDDGGIFASLKQARVGRPGHVAVIVVNASTDPPTHLNVLARAPGLLAVVNAISGVQIHRYNFDTLELLRDTLARWAREVPPDEHGRKLQTHMIEVAFDNLDDPAEREFFNSVRTSLDLEDETVTRLIEVGGRLLRESPEFQDLLRAIAETSGSAGSGNDDLPTT